MFELKDIEYKGRFLKIEIELKTIEFFLKDKLLISDEEYDEVRKYFIDKINKSIKK